VSAVSSYRQKPHFLDVVHSQAARRDPAFVVPGAVRDDEPARLYFVCATPFVAAQAASVNVEATSAYVGAVVQPRAVLQKNAEVRGSALSAKPRARRSPGP
jgi:hypothetical protein